MDILLYYVENYRILCGSDLIPSMPCPVVRRMSVTHLSLTFHIFYISSRAVSWIELKLSERHFGNMEIQNC